MRICTHQSLIAGICFASLVSGCGRSSMVSSDRYIDDAIALDSQLTAPADRTIYGYAPPYGTGSTQAPGTISPRYEAAPRIIIRDSDFDEGDAAYIDDRWTDWEDTPRNRDFYRSDVRTSLTALDNELTEIKARADLKGAAARAAIDPHVRDYNMALDVIEDNLDPLFSDGGDDWLLRAQRTENALERAYKAVGDAEQALRDTPTYD